ncbi:hypothetical protein [Verrucosispora sp. TAA-831]|uniref:hypothetical protein n=1 Tax=Verrucosispora sp. TAA-831 TaxID=3422227 RepID=UPI003D6F3E93
MAVAVLVAAVLAGTALVATDHRPASVAAAMHPLVQALWEVGLVVAGIVGLAGLAWPGSLSVRLGVEAVGMVLLGTTTTMYGIALYVVSGTAAIAAGAFIAAVAVASWIRAAQTLRDLHRVGAAAQRGRTANIPLLVDEDSPP